MNAHGFNSKQLSDKQGTRVVSEAMKDKFEDFKEGISTAKGMAQTRSNKEVETRKKIYSSVNFTLTTRPTYLEFLKPLSDNGKDKVHSIIASANDNSLSICYHIGYLYFRVLRTLQSNDPTFKFRPPSTIREMLYFLAALPFSHNYDSLNSYVNEHFRKPVKNESVSEDAELMIPVADSASYNTNNTLSAADLKDYLTTTCHHSTTLLSVIQGNSGSGNPDEPWLHELFSNNAFHLMYPSGPTLFRSLSSYTYALQFQLYFLYAQSYSTHSQGCGWKGCRYGRDINKKANTQVTSHICQGYDCAGSDNCKHDGQNGSTSCKHNTYSDPTSCGSKGKPSPLQAFLTDNRQGFTHGLPDSPGHLDDHPPGSMCHVKMGFNPEHLRQNAGTSNYIYSVLSGFCGSHNTPLRQLYPSVQIRTSDSREFGTKHLLYIDDLKLLAKDDWGQVSYQLVKVRRYGKVA
ncbi:uncharacterized protein BcabD6B2_18360 [Babesia caballi]|uniref:Uncharacterized protein n=1 Tax=Babesia caballi TaxID=5871 RepID=A0AAV4LQH4_BABCB|nr:hypothetical protein, conserved [Babesia caballi]